MEILRASAQYGQVSGRARCYMKGNPLDVFGHNCELCFLKPKKTCLLLPIVLFVRETDPFYPLLHPLATYWFSLGSAIEKDTIAYFVTSLHNLAFCYLGEKEALF